MDGSHRRVVRKTSTIPTFVDSCIPGQAIFGPSIIRSNSFLGLLGLKTRLLPSPRETSKLPPSICASIRSLLATFPFGQTRAMGSSKCAKSLQVVLVPYFLKLASCGLWRASTPPSETAILLVTYIRGLLN